MTRSCKPSGLDSMPIELLPYILEHLGGRSSDYAPLTLVARRYFGLARAAMVRTVRMAGRARLRSFVTMVESDRWHHHAIDALYISPGDEMEEAEAELREAASVGAWADARGRDEQIDRRLGRDFAELVERVARSVGPHVAAVAVTIRWTQLPYLVVPAMRAMTLNKYARLHVTEAYDGRARDVTAAMFDAVVRLFEGARRIEVTQNMFMTSLISEDFRTDGRDDLFPYVEHLRVTWDDRGLGRALAHQMPRLHTLCTASAVPDMQIPVTTDPVDSAFAARIRHLQVRAFQSVAGGNFLPFISLQRLQLRWMYPGDTFVHADLPRSLEEIRIEACRVSTSTFASALAALAHLPKLRRIVLDRAGGWTDDRDQATIPWYGANRVLDARNVRAACAARSIELVVGRAGDAAEEDEWYLS